MVVSRFKSTQSYLYKLLGGTANNIEVFLLIKCYSVDCPNGDDELECPAELMSIIEAEVEQCIKPTPIEGTIDGTSVDGACLEADFDQQRDCICTSE